VSLNQNPGNFKDAQSDFFESFRSYDEAGSLQRIQVLKYLVLTAMLNDSDINPLDSQETKPYRGDARIAAMTELVDAYHAEDIHRYQAILQANQDLLADSFIAENIDEVTRNMRTKAVVKLVAPYTRFKLSFVARQLNITEEEVQDIVGFLIMDKKLSGKINQAKGTVDIENVPDEDRLRAVSQWEETLNALAKVVLADGDIYRSDNMSEMRSEQMAVLPGDRRKRGPPRLGLAY